MNQKYIIVKGVFRRKNGALALKVVSPEGVDLQFVYRAAISIYLNPSDMLLEDRCEIEVSPIASSQRITRALKQEYGMYLRPSPDITWEGIGEDTRRQVEKKLFI
jgi:hypothetical protein